MSVGLEVLEQAVPPDHLAAAPALHVVAYRVHGRGGPPTDDGGSGRGALGLRPGPPQRLAAAALLAVLRDTDAADADADADASDAVERLSEQQQSSCSAEEAVKDESAESRTMEATVLAPAADAAACGCVVLGFLLDGHGQAGAGGGGGGGGGGKEEVSLALPWKRELRASLLVTMAAAALEVKMNPRNRSRGRRKGWCVP